MFEELLNDELLASLQTALEQHEDFEYSKDGLDIQFKSSDNGLNLVISYDNTESQMAEKEMEDFITYLSGLDDSIFIEVCEFIGNEKITAIHNCLHSGSLESVRSGINMFNQAHKEYLINQINYYQECLNRLRK